MSNEVKAKWREWLEDHPEYGHPYTLTEIYSFLDQFEGYRLIKDRPGCNGWYCQCCGKPQPGRVKVAIWRDLETGKDKYLCKSCFDKQCPEPAAKPAEPTMRCTSCGIDCKTGHAYWEDRAVCMTCFIDLKREYDAPAKSEPEPWAELTAYVRELDNNDCGVNFRHAPNSRNVFEAAYPEIERRASRMIDKAIKAERERLCDVLRCIEQDKVGFVQSDELVRMCKEIAEGLEEAANAK